MRVIKTAKLNHCNNVTLEQIEDTPIDIGCERCKPDIADTPYFRLTIEDKPELLCYPCLVDFLLEFHEVKLVSV